MILEFHINKNARFSDGNKINPSDILFSFNQLREFGRPNHRNYYSRVKKVTITSDSSIKFLINDDPILSKKINADGCHLGQKDMDIKNARKIIGNKIIGITCHNSIRLAKAAVKDKASYIAFGSFFSTTTKKVKFKATTKILHKVKKLTKTPIVAIGGINFDNYKKLLLNKANLLATSGYIWNNKKYKPLESVEKLK